MVNNIELIMELKKNIKKLLTMMIQFDIIFKRYKLNRDKYSGEEKYSRG